MNKGGAWNKGPCSIDGCDKPSKTANMCGMHYQRLLARGTTDEPPKRGRPPEFMDEIRALRKPPRRTDCGHPDRKHYAKGLCSPCYQAQANKPWRERNKDMLRRYSIARSHGLTVAEYDAMWERQENRCANPRCRAEFDRDSHDHRNGLQIDHDHASGQVRGLLCKACNSALGHIKDDTDRLLGLIEYLHALN